MASWLQGKTVILTGATGGIGREMTRILIQKYGCLVIGIGRDQTKAQALCSELGENADRCVPCFFDVSDRAQWYRFADRLERQKHMPDLLVNNAGVLPHFRRFAADRSTCSEPGCRAADGSPFDSDVTLIASDQRDRALAESIPVSSAGPMEDALRAMRVNYLAPLYAAEALLPLLLRSSAPGIVNVSSSAALVSLPGTAGYSASKAALKSFTEALAQEYRGRMYVGLFCPGFTRTDIFREQRHASQNRLISLVSSDPVRMANRMVRAIGRRRRKGVFGSDAKAMNWLYRAFGVHSLDWFRFAMQHSRMELFDDIFCD